tara:strand:+ start:564 stop:785 length:222 start_codon:yes stop_codon:yes gene_type:complete
MITQNNYSLFMNKENAIKLLKIIQEAGDFLKKQLPEHPNHPKGKNPYAHIAISIKVNLIKVIKIFQTRNTMKS